MSSETRTQAAGGDTPRRLYFFNAGFLRQRRLRRILHLAGYRLRLGRPGAGDEIAVWGRSPYAARGEAVAEHSGAALVRIEDAFLRSLFPGRAGEPPIGLMIDHSGVHFDASAPSDLETLLASHPFDDTTLLNRARGGIARMREAHLSKYNAFDPDAALPDPGYVLVIDQTHGDASVRFGGADRNTFREMLYWAQEDFPAARIIVKTHPETQSGLRGGYFDATDVNGRVSLFSDPVSPWALMEGAVAVYVVSSQFGFEAILAGHRPVVFGRPFYAGWGLSDDRHPQDFPRRRRKLTRAQLFAGVMLEFPVWYDPARDRLCRFEDAVEQLAAEARAWRDDHLGWVASGMRLWKRPVLQAFFGRQQRVRFADRPAPPRRWMCWASRAAEVGRFVRVEDGFLRSRGLGARLVPPLSLVLDDLGIYYDPSGESRLERLIAQRARLRPEQQARAEALIDRLVGLGLSKYNLGGALPDLPIGRRVLVPGQVEDDASIRRGAGAVASNLALLRAARQANPDAVILFKPHPDVEAGLRPGAVDPESLQGLADAVLTGTDPAALLDQIDEVWTMTSLIGFEALLRGKRVVTTGAPFYAGWGLTRDLGDVPPRRRARVSLAGLAHATLIDYPRYRDPVSGLPCPVELVVDRLASGKVARPGLANRLLSKAQGLLASRAHLWR
ncbi:capsular polysaccharide biosynthesis protein [Pseudooceanicola sp.]|uniref:capsular polysaccharide biosynthesis protein n=1 Tax=Pseudooceanicola sp. TaxID=1914328 RepID=UPI00262A2123|nr:capsular polysaccharide biosynthesis protein [Pseudooceanicola sp.]MDF1853914.1 capsular polysaccharide biosynthesis protein [Pseudooceanicola sp.]